MAEGSAEEEQSSTAAPASPPADLRTLNTQLSSPYHHQPHLQSRLQHLQHSNMLATAVPPRHSHSMLSHQVKAEAAELDAPCDVPLNLKSEVSAEISVSYPHPPLPTPRPSSPPPSPSSPPLSLSLSLSLRCSSIIDATGNRLVAGETVLANGEWRVQEQADERLKLDARAMSVQLIGFNYYAGYRHVGLVSGRSERSRAADRESAVLLKRMPGRRSRSSRSLLTLFCVSMTSNCALSSRPTARSSRAKSANGPRFDETEHGRAPRATMPKSARWRSCAESRDLSPVIGRLASRR